jgi:hypothetical protein
MTNKMNDFVLNQLLAENEKLQKELESSKKAVKTSEAIKTLLEFVNKEKSEPMDKNNWADCDNPFTKTGGCFG